MVRTGDIVFYHYVIAGEKTGEEVRLPALVTVTHEDWSPGYHNLEGDWVANKTIPQPGKDRVHLAAFYVVGPSGQNSTIKDFFSVPHKSVAKAGESYFEERAAGSPETRPDA